MLLRSIITVMTHIVTIKCLDHHPICRIIVCCRGGYVMYRHIGRTKGAQVTLTTCTIQWLAYTLNSIIILKATAAII